MCAKLIIFMCSECSSNLNRCIEQSFPGKTTKVAARRLQHRRFPMNLKNTYSAEHHRTTSFESTLVEMYIHK